MPANLQDLLERTAVRHDHLCPRQVLGVRMGVAGLQAVGLEAPISKSTGLTIVETDGCFADGIEVSTGATVGHRSLRVVDYGKIAATFVNLSTGTSIRLAPRPEVRVKACEYAPAAQSRYDSQLEGYRDMPDGELFRRQIVELTPPWHVLISQADVRVKCTACGEEIFNEREVLVGNAVFCRSCADGGYYGLDAKQSKAPRMEQIPCP